MRRKDPFVTAHSQETCESIIAGLPFASDHVPQLYSLPHQCGSMEHVAQACGSLIGPRLALQRHPLRQGPLTFAPLNTIPRDKVQRGCIENSGQSPSLVSKLDIHSVPANPMCYGSELHVLCRLLVPTRSHHASPLFSGMCSLFGCPYLAHHLSPEWKLAARHAACIRTQWRGP